MDWLIAVKTCSALNASWALRDRQIQARRRAGPIIANAKQLSRRVEGSGRADRIRGGAGRPDVRQNSRRTSIG